MDGVVHFPIADTSTFKIHNVDSYEINHRFIGSWILTRERTASVPSTIISRMLHYHNIRKGMILTSLMVVLGYSTSFQPQLMSNNWHPVPNKLSKPSTSQRTVSTLDSPHILNKFPMSMCQTSLLMSTKSQSSTESADAPKTRNKILVVGKRKIRPVTLNHERDFFRQAARLESMDSYLLVSTLTASMSFGALLGFSPVIRAVEVAAMSSFRAVWYNSICSAIPVVAGFSAIFGLYATVMFSLTVLYGKSALGSERDLPYDKFLRRTVRCRVHGARCFNLSLGFFAFEAFLVMLERTFNRPWFVGVLATTVGTLWYLFRDWRLIFRMAEYIYKD